jgi:hypothetical protein
MAGCIDSSRGWLCGVVVMVAAATAGAVPHNPLGDLAPRDDNSLTPGMPKAGVVAGNEGAATYSFEAASPGLLSAVVIGKGDSDLILTVANAAGIPLPNAQFDNDPHQRSDVEYGAVAITQPGSYRLVVSSHGDGGQFQIVCGWIAVPSLALPDPIAVGVEQGEVLTLGEARAGVVPNRGGKWYKVTAAEGGLLIVHANAPNRDIAMAAYAQNQPHQALVNVDGDLRGNPGLEVLTLPIEAGETLLIQVTSLDGNRADFRVHAQVLPLNR